MAGRISSGGGTRTTSTGSMLGWVTTANFGGLGGRRPAAHDVQGSGVKIMPSKSIGRENYPRFLQWALSATQARRRSALRVVCRLLEKHGRMSPRGR